MDALAKRSTTRAFDSKDLSPQQLSRLLWASFGTNRPDGAALTDGKTLKVGGDRRATGHNSRVGKGALQFQHASCTFF
jgi:hypothetical protein